jgi:hypothetical protein
MQQVCTYDCAISSVSSGGLQKSAIVVFTLPLTNFLYYKLWVPESNTLQVVLETVLCISLPLAIDCLHVSLHPRCFQGRTVVAHQLHRLAFSEYSHRKQLLISRTMKASFKSNTAIQMQERCCRKCIAK